jgi:hypothetical protein
MMDRDLIKSLRPGMDEVAMAHFEEFVAKKAKHHEEIFRGLPEVDGDIYMLGCLVVAQQLAERICPAELPRMKDAYRELMRNLLMRIATSVQ